MPHRLLCLVLAALTLPAVLPPSEKNATDFIITLRAQDALSAALNLDTMQHSGEVSGGELILDDAGLVFGVYAKGQLSFGFRRDEAALLIDLGALKVEGVTVARDVAPRPEVSIYDTLHLQDNKVVYDRPVGRTARPPRGQMIFGNYPVEGIQHVKPQPGHVYLLRTRDPKLKGARERIVKFLVLEATEQSVCLRMARFKAM